MDSLYYSAPRPYNKYPRGYRPIHESNTDLSLTTSRRLRPSSSWSSFSQTTCAGLQSPDHTNKNNNNTWQEDFSRRPFRTESSSTLFDNYLSPRELSPFSTSSEYCNLNSSSNMAYSGSNVQSPVPDYPRCYDNVPRPPTSYEQRENDFLRNLQRQKEVSYSNSTPRQDMSASWYGQDHGQNQPRRLAKTQSETGFDYNPTSNYASHNVSNNNHRMDGFFRNRVIEPSWMTDPPPPKSFREEYIIRNNQPVPANNSSFERFRLDPSYREPTSVTIHSQEPTNFRSYHRDDHMQPRAHQHQLGPQTLSNPVFDREPVNHPYQNVPNNSQIYNERHNNRNSAIYPSDPIPLSHNRVLHIHSTPNQESLYSHQHSNPISNYQQNTNTYPMQRARIQSPLRDYARLTSPNRETIVDVHHNHHREPKEIDDRIFSPVESKVYNRNGPTVINGFTSNRHTYNSHTDDYDARNRRDSSQPPVAVIEPNINVNMPIDPIPYTKPHLGHGHNHGHTRKPDQRYSRQELSPVSNYDNEDSDLDIEELARKALPKYLRDSTPSSKSDYYRDNLQGILIKNPSIHRSSSKKVVFIDQDKASAGSKIPPDVQAYDSAIGDLIESWSQVSDKIGGDVITAKAKVLKTFDQFRNFLWFAAGNAKPSDDEVNKMIGKIGESMQEITDFKDSKRNTPQFNHLSAIAETMGALGWVMSKTPAPVIKDYIEASMFFGNRIMKEFKESDPKQVEWINAWKSIFEEMQKFVRQVHTTGLIWNSSPGSAPPTSSGSAAAPPAPKGPGGPPPPPPPPIPSDLFANLPPAPSNTDKSNRDALFAALNKGEAITSGLKKVTSDMQTHKNPGLRGNAAAPATASKAAASPAKPAQPVRKPARKELQDGKQWNVEYFVNDNNIVIDVADKKQTIYVFRCENSVIKVNGKANSITLDGCKKTSIVFDALVAQCETINCQSVQIQTLGELPTLSIQKTDGCQVYLSKVAQGCEIITSKSSEMNILVQTTDEGDYNEFPVPEQFKTTFVNGKLVTTVSDIV
ncbi:unnamed protein product [Caenorhabditis angaria]|uniref:C-CAP/cofactor C-like domain-containing protein n=1 Tax=Caenorhabditis angaria TaxID=860376 RepID=A0A9P1IY79_9PELO|nr:unnamed protein product [Caenorhabditis angaria]